MILQPNLLRKFFNSLKSTFVVNRKVVLREELQDLTQQFYANYYGLKKDLSFNTHYRYFKEQILNLVEIQRITFKDQEFIEVADYTNSLAQLV